MLKDKDNLAYQAFPWSIVGIATISWLFIFGVTYLFMLGMLRGFSLTLLPEGVSPGIMLLLPIQGLVLLSLVLRIKYVIRKGNTPSYIQIIISLILTVTTGFSVFVVLTHKRDVSISQMPRSLRTPYDLTTASGVDLDAQKFPVEAPIAGTPSEKKSFEDIKRSEGNFYLSTNDLFRPFGKISHRILQNKIYLLFCFLIPSCLIAAYINRFLLKRQYKEDMHVSPLALTLSWGIALLAAIPVSMFSEYLIGFALFPALGNFLTICEIRKNVPEIKDGEEG